MQLSAAVAVITAAHPASLVLCEPASDPVAALLRVRQWLVQADGGHVLLIGPPSAALAQFARSLAAELGPQGQRANALAVQSSAGSDDLLHAAGFLLSEEASYVTGATVMLGES